MRARGWTGLLVAAALTLAAAPAGGPQARSIAPPEPVEVAQVYDVYLGGIFAGEIAVNARIGRTSYRADTVLRTAGIVAVFYKAEIRAEAEGRVSGARLVPVRFSADTRDPKKHQSVEITYRRGTPGAVKAEPAFQPKPWQIEPAEQAGTFDPITAMLAALAPSPREALCNRTVEVFDGRRRYAIELAEPETRGAAVRCGAVYRRIAGYKPKLMTRKRARWPFRVFFRPGADGVFQVERVMGNTPFGTAVAKRRRGAAG